MKDGYWFEEVVARRGTGFIQKIGYYVDNIEESAGDLKDLLFLESVREHR